MSVTCGIIEVRFWVIGITNDTYLRDSDKYVGRWTIEFLSFPIHIPRYLLP
jgi:hypothetical protein